MITYHKDYGCWFQMTEDSKHYGIYKMQSYSCNDASDVVVVFDHDNKEVIQSICGASAFDWEDLDVMITNKIIAYEAKQTSKKPSRGSRLLQIHQRGYNTFYPRCRGRRFQRIGENRRRICKLGIQYLYRQSSHLCADVCGNFRTLRRVAHWSRERLEVNE